MASWKEYILGSKATQPDHFPSPYRPGSKELCPRSCTRILWQWSAEYTQRANEARARMVKAAEAKDSEAEDQARTEARNANDWAVKYADAANEAERARYT